MVLRKALTISRVIITPEGEKYLVVNGEEVPLEEFVEALQKILSNENLKMAEFYFEIYEPWEKRDRDI